MTVDDLPEDLLGTIYRCCSYRSDRARFAAVCRSWRAAASWQPKLPALPLLLNSTGNGALDREARAYSIEDDRVLRAPLRWFPYGKRIVGCYDGGWVAAAIGLRIDIVNLFTRAWVLEKGHMRPMYDETSIEKIIFSKDPSTEGCILAVMTKKCIALYRSGRPSGGWMGRGCYKSPSHYEDFIDIAFCNGDLYGLTDCGDLLHRLVIGDNAPVFLSLEKLMIQRSIMFDPQYIFVLHGKLATAAEATLVSKNGARSFRVFELASRDTTQSSKYTWAEVTSLGDHALFLGPGCCKAVRVSSAGMRGVVKANRIYYSKHLYQVDSKCLASLDLGSCAVHCYDSGETPHSERIKSRGYHYSEKYDGINGRNSCTWILPPEF